MPGSRDHREWSLMRDLRGRVAVVTGAASGIGRAMVDAFVGEGMKVVLADVERGALDEAVSTLTAQGAEAIGVRVDVSREDDVEGLAAATMQRFGAVHVLCNNAGVDTGAPFAELPISAWRWVMDVNLFGVVNGCRTFLPLLKQAEEAHIVNTASLSGVSAGIPTIAPYVASKFAVLGLSENLAVELQMTAPTVGISVLLPGAVRTRMPDAERNKPEGLEVPVDSLRAQVADGIRAAAADGIEPAAVAQLVVDGIREDRFYLLPHRDGALNAVRNRLVWMQNDERPVGRLPGT